MEEKEAKQEIAKRALILLYQTNDFERFVAVRALEDYISTLEAELAAKAKE